MNIRIKMAMTKKNYLSEHFGENRTEFLMQLKEATEILVKDAKIHYEDDDFCASILKGKKYGVTFVKDKKKGVNIVFLKDYEGYSVKDIKNDDFFNVLQIKKRKKEDGLEADSFSYDRKVFSYRLEDEKPNDIVKGLLDFLKREDADDLVKNNLFGKTKEEQLAFAKTYGFDSLGEEMMPIFFEPSYYVMLKKALLKKVDYETAQTLGSMAKYLEHLNIEKNISLSFDESDYEAMNKYGLLYKDLLPAWGGIFEEMKIEFAAQGIISPEAAANNTVNSIMWLEDNFITIRLDSYEMIIDCKDARNYNVYLNNYTEDREDFIKKIKTNKINRVSEVVLSIKEGDVTNANPEYLYLLNLDMEFGYKELLNSNVLKENKEKYNYDYYMKYMATLYNASELNVLYRAFAGLGTGIEYNAEYGSFSEGRVFKLNSLKDYVPATEAFESSIFVLQTDFDNMRGFKINHLSKDWHNGLKKLIKNYDVNKVEIENELKTLYSHLKDQKITDQKMKELPKMMNKLKKLDKALDKENKTLVSSSKVKM